VRARNRRIAYAPSSHAESRLPGHSAKEVGRQKSDLTERSVAISYSTVCALFGNVTYRASQWAILATLARLGTKSDISQFGLAQAICNPFMMLAYLQLSQLMAADAARCYSFATVSRLRTYSATLAVTAVAAITLLLPGLHTSWMVILVLVMAKFTESQSEVYYGLLRQVDRLDIIALLQFLRALCTLAAFTLFFWCTRNLACSLMGLCLVWSMLLLLADRTVGLRYADPAVLRDRSRDDAAGEMQRLVLASLPLGLASALGAMYTYFPQYLLDATGNSGELAVYVVVVSLPLIFETVILSSSQAFAAWFGTCCHRGDRLGFWRLYRHMLVVHLSLGLAAVLGTWLFGRQLLTLAFSAEFAKYTELLRWVMVASAIAAIAGFSPVFLGLRRYGVFLTLWIVAMLVMIVLGSALIPAYGAKGAAMTVVAVNGVRCVMNHLAIRRLANRTFKSAWNETIGEPVAALRAQVC
jgi:O-antigen/teichoic acid export membrane protein